MFGPTFNLQSNYKQGVTMGVAVTVAASLAWTSPFLDMEPAWNPVKEGEEEFSHP